MEKYTYNEQNGLWYELQGDYYLPCLKLPEEETAVHIGIWGQRQRPPQGAIYLPDNQRQAEQLPCRHRPAGRGNALSAGRADETDAGFHEAAKG